MNKYKWSLLGLIISIILLIIFSIEPIVNLNNEQEKRELPPIENLIEQSEQSRSSVSFSDFFSFGFSFPFCILFLTLIIIFSFLVFNYKKGHK